MLVLCCYTLKSFFLELQRSKGGLFIFYYSMDLTNLMNSRYIFKAKMGASSAVPYFLFWCCCIKLLGDDVHHWLTVTLLKSTLLFSWDLKIGENIPGTHQVSKKCISVFILPWQVCFWPLHICWILFKRRNAYLGEVKFVICESCGSGGAGGRKWRVFFRADCSGMCYII